MQAVNRAAEIAVNARSEVRETYSAYRTAYDLARHYRDEIVPLRKRISEENVLRYNGMLISVFELLADAREQVGERERCDRSAARFLARRDRSADGADRRGSPRHRRRRESGGDARVGARPAAIEATK